MNAFILVLGCFRRRGKDSVYNRQIWTEQQQKKGNKYVNWTDVKFNLTTIVGRSLNFFIFVIFLPRLTKITSTNHKPRDNQKGDRKEINPVHRYGTKSQL